MKDCVSIKSPPCSFCAPTRTCCKALLLMSFFVFVHCWVILCQQCVGLWLRHRPPLAYYYLVSASIQTCFILSASLTIGIFMNRNCDPCNKATPSPTPKFLS